MEVSVPEGLLLQDILCISRPSVQSERTGVSDDTRKSRVKTLKRFVAVSHVVARLAESPHLAFDRLVWEEVFLSRCCS